MADGGMARVYPWSWTNTDSVRIVVHDHARYPTNIFQLAVRKRSDIPWIRNGKPNAAQRRCLMHVGPGR